MLARRWSPPVLYPYAFSDFISYCFHLEAHGVSYYIVYVHFFKRLYFVLFSLLEAHGIGDDNAALLLSMLGAAQIFGRTAHGLLADRVGAVEYVLKCDIPLSCEIRNFGIHGVLMDNIFQTFWFSKMFSSCRGSRDPWKYDIVHARFDALVSHTPT